MTDDPRAASVSPAPNDTSGFSGRAFEIAVRFYRQTIKRIYPVHVGVHWVVSHTIIPLLESIKRFKTVPDDPFWFRLELLLNQHESETVAHIKSRLQPGMVVLDIGAHIGYYSRIFGNLVGRSGRVLAFEPHPRTFITLRRNTRRQMHVELHQVAVSDVREETQLFDYLLMSASGSLHYDEALANLQREQTSDYAVAPRMRDTFTPQTYTVQAVVLDNYLAALGIDSVDFIKMDIEGAELTALTGMRDIIRQSPHLQLIMEFNPKALTAFGHDPQSVIQQVLDMGFHSVEAIMPDGKLQPLAARPETVDALVASLESTLGVVNLLFVRRSG